MNKDENKLNISTIILQLGNLISDWRKVESPAVIEIAEEIIIDKAAELLEAARPKKSEMACNCLHECEGEELPKEFIDAWNSVANILGHMTETQKNALASKICSDMHFDILQAVRKTFED